MTLGEIVVYVLLALLCGLVGQSLAGRSVGGYLVTAVVGLLGALLGHWLARALDAPTPLRVSVGGESLPLLWAVVGAALVTVLVVKLRPS